jgi:hypothetical protein
MGKFPTSGVLTLASPLPTGSGAAPANHHTWLTYLLPYVEQGPLYNATDLKKIAWGQPIVSTNVPVLKCPSDGGYDKPDETQGIAFTNYAGAEGYHWWETAYLDPAWGGAWTQLPKAGDYSGLFACTRTFKIADVTDGTSNVVVVAETDSYGFKNGGFQTTNSGVRRARGGESVFRAAFVFTGIYGRSSQPPYRKPDDSGAMVPEQSGGAWFRSAPYDYSPTYITAWGINTEWPGASSMHTGGIMCARGDGSVSFVRSSIAWGTWVAFNGVADGSTINVD